MLKVFFADGGSLEQLDATLALAEATSADRLRELRGMAEQALLGDSAYPQRRHIAAVALQVQVEQEAAVLVAVRTAREQARAWRTSTDPGGWDHREPLLDIVRTVDRLVPAP